MRGQSGYDGRPTRCRMRKVTAPRRQQWHHGALRPDLGLRYTQVPRADFESAEICCFLTLASLATSIRAAMGDILAAAVRIELIKMTAVLAAGASRSARRLRANGLGINGSLL